MTDSHSVSQQEIDLREQIADVLEEITERIEAGQAINLDQYTQQYPELADQLQKLVPAISVLESLGLSATKRATDDKPIVDQLGDFRIMRELGRGGMGIVYEAEQLSVGRRVALKILPFAAVLDAKQLKRFKNEAMAAGSLEHPHIVPVYCVGCDRGVHYYAMRLVEGRSLAQWIAQLRGAEVAASDTLSVPIAEAETAPIAQTTSPEDGLPVKHFQRVTRLGLQAAGALQHMHEMGLIHRDIKPSNLLVDSRGHLWIADFGLAHMPSDATLTMTGDLVGTLRYMSPEQALPGSTLVDHRTDIYSLGSTLYELLTLRPIYDGGNRQELLRQLASDDPVPPRRIQPKIPIDLETIVLKSISRDPAMRYGSSEELAEDLRRFLDHEPILARRPTRVDRVLKWTGRHVAFFATVSALLVFITLVSIGGALFLSHQRNLARQERDVAERQRELTQAHLQTAREALETLRTQVAQQLEDDVDSTTMQRDVLEKTRQFYQQLLKDASDDPDLQHEASVAYQRLGRVCLDLGTETQKAFNLLGEARRTQEKLVAEHPSNVAYRLSLAKTLRDLASAIEVHTVVGAPPPSELYQESITLLESILDEQPNNAQCKLELAESLVGMHSAWSKLDEDVRREGTARAVAILKPLVDENPDDTDYLFALGEALFSHSVQPGQDAETHESLLREAVDIFESLMAADGRKRAHRIVVAQANYSLGKTLQQQGELQEGATFIDRGIQYQEALVSDYPKVRDFRTRVGWMHRLQFYWLLGRRQLVQASSFWERFVEHRRATLEYWNNENEQALLRRSLYIHALILLELGETELARAAFEECLTLIQRLAAEQPDDEKWPALYAWTNVVCPFSEVTDQAGAIEEAIRSGHTDVVGWSQYRAGNWMEAAEAFERAQGSGPIGVCSHHLGLAACKWHLGKTGEAVEHLRRAIIDIQQLKPDDPELYFASRRLCVEVLTRTGWRMTGPEDNGPGDLAPERHAVLVREPPEQFEISGFAPPVLDDEPLPRQVEARVEKDGLRLREGVDYQIEYGPQTSSVVIRPTTGSVFGEGRYQVLINDVSFRVVVASSLPIPRRVDLRVDDEAGGPTLVCRQQGTARSLIAAGAIWKYLDDGSDQGITWRNRDFDDSHWKSGPAQLGFGDGDEQTIVSFGADPENKFATTYFRHRFSVPDPDDVGLLMLHLVRDDGAAVYLNGQEIVREGLSPDAAFHSFADISIGGDSESRVMTHRVDSNLLVTGSNCIAAEIHQCDATSSDLSFGLRLDSLPYVEVLVDELIGDGKRQIPPDAKLTFAKFHVWPEKPTSKLELVCRDDDQWAVETLVVEGTNATDSGDFVFDVRDRVQQWCDGGSSGGWILLPRADAAVDDREVPRMELHLDTLRVTKLPASHRT